MPAELSRFLSQRQRACACQVSESYHGAAAVHMLLCCLGIGVAPQQITEAAGVYTTIAAEDIRRDQWARTIRSLVPDMHLWHKEYPSVADLEVLVSGHT